MRIVLLHIINADLLNFLFSLFEMVHCHNTYIHTYITVYTVTIPKEFLHSRV